MSTSELKFCVPVGNEPPAKKAMPSTDPRDIEILAINEARKLAAHKDADVKMRAALADAIDAIEKTGYGEVVQMLEQLKADPNWMGGLLQKKK